MHFQEIVFTDTDKLNDDLYARFRELSAAGRVRQTHHFGGRFENTYIDEADIPVIRELLERVKQQAGKLLGIAGEDLKTGFWFNAMEAGQWTAPHHHDENDELLSGVYYIRVPENSGDLLLHRDDEHVRIRPQAGKLVLFPPAVVHEVTVNRSPGMRLSVAVNVGPA